jgi:uroporphyrinogen-III synthase
MRVVVTRPQADSERTAVALEALGHEVLVAPLMRIEPVAVDLAGTWSAIVITSANALQAVPATADGVKTAACVCRWRSERRGSAAGQVSRR